MKRNNFIKCTILVLILFICSSNIFGATWDKLSQEDQSALVDFMNMIDGDVDKLKDDPANYLTKAYKDYVNRLDKNNVINTQNIAIATEKYNELIKKVNVADYEENQANLDFWGQATNWFNKIETSGDNPEIKELVDTFQDMINVLGTTVIVLVTIFLGIKYIFGSVESKAGVKEGLVTLIVVCVFFFGWSALRNLLFPNNSLIFIESTDTSYTSILGRIFSIATFIANILAILGIVYVGIRYIFAGASGKGELKAKSPMLLIGIILAFASVSFLSYISKVISEIIV